MVKHTAPYTVASGGTAWRSQLPAVTTYDLPGSPAQTTALDGALTTLSPVFSFYGSFFYQGI